MNQKRSLAVSFVLGLFCLALIFSVTAAFSGQEGGMYGGQDKQDMMKRMPSGHPGMDPSYQDQGMMYGPSESMPAYFRERLGLDEKQAEQMHKVYSEYRKEMVRRHADIEVAEMEMGDLLEGKKIDMKDIEKAVKKDRKSVV